MIKDLSSQYIEDLYKDYSIIKRDEFEKGTSLKFYCPVIETSVAIFLKVFFTAIKPKNVLELGGSIGYSTTIIADTISKWDGKLTSIELDSKVAAAAKENFKKYNVQKNIILINKNVFDALPLIDERYDVIFIDLFNDIYPDVLDKCIDLLNEGGVLIADDTLFPVVKDNKYFKKSNKSLDEFNKRIATRNDLESILIPFDDGITIAVKK